MVWEGEEVEGGGVKKDNLSMEGFAMGEENFNVGVQDLLALFKKTMKK